MSNKASSILVLGAGELGMSVLHGFAEKSVPNQQVTVLLRPSTANLPRQAPKVAPLYRLENDTQILPCDLVESTQNELAQEFGRFDVVIGCTGYDQNSAGSGEGLQRKIANAVLDASKSSGNPSLYVPWQFGVDYDQFEYGDAAGLFDEQKDIRQLLRQSEPVHNGALSWIIISTGIFMSYLFSDFWGVVQRDQATGMWTVNALGNWETETTVTTARDIGRLTAEIVTAALQGDSEAQRLRNTAVFIGGETLTYSHVINVVEQATGQAVQRGRLRDMAGLENTLSNDHTDVLNKYRVAFGRGKGVSWPIEKTFNFTRGIPVQNAKSWATENLK